MFFTTVFAASIDRWSRMLVLKLKESTKSDESNRIYVSVELCVVVSVCVCARTKFAMQIVRYDFVTASVTMVSIKTYS